MTDEETRNAEIVARMATSWYAAGIVPYVEAANTLTTALRDEQDRHSHAAQMAADLMIERDALRAVVREVEQQMRNKLSRRTRLPKQWVVEWPDVQQWADTLAAALRPTGAGKEP